MSLSSLTVNVYLFVPVNFLCTVFLIRSFKAELKALLTTMYVCLYIISQINSSSTLWRGRRLIYEYIVIKTHGVRSINNPSYVADDMITSHVHAYTHTRICVHLCLLLSCNKPLCIIFDSLLCNIIVPHLKHVPLKVTPVVSSCIHVPHVACLFVCLSVCVYIFYNV